MRHGRRSARQLPPHSYRARITVVVVLGAGLLALGSCIRDPTAGANLGQTVVEIGDAVRVLQQETAVMQDQVDSLLHVVARQDTLIKRLSGIAPAPQP